MADAVRSPVPDLLFDDERDARVAELGRLVNEPDRVNVRTPLHRLTVFLTYRCNLDCPYCKTIARSEAELDARPQKRRTFTEAEFSTLLAQHSGTPLRHLHFTGGEASLVHGLDELVRLAKRAGVERLSMTTNGTLPAARLLRLVDAGLDELRLSLDAGEPALGAALTGRQNAWARAMATLQGLCAARRQGAPFFLIVNTVVGVANRARLPELVGLFLSLGIDDLKLITDVDAKGHLGDFPGVAEVKARLHAVLARYPATSFPLLRRKVETVFAPDAIGLPQATAGSGWRCFIPLTERTVDGESYYPCSVYLREGGTPLGPTTDAPEVQRRVSARFVATHDCAADAICQRYCLHCTRAYNDAVNARRRR
ncbi:MAG: radical SAM protein [Myxococcaceae bacterium]|nr:radical SAM protein [Myxococcaceae bacterium]